VAAAALTRVPGRRRVAVMTGGNIDAVVLAALLARAPRNAARESM
jgi:hypothetical protein